MASIQITEDELLELIEEETDDDFEPTPGLDTSWMAEGACVGARQEVFFPGRGRPTNDAKRACFGCRVQPACLEYALDANIKTGIWGGLSERERRRLRRQRKQVLEAGGEPQPIAVLLESLPKPPARKPIRVQARNQPETQIEAPIVLPLAKAIPTETSRPSETNGKATTITTKAQLRQIIFLTVLASSQNGRWDEPSADWMNNWLPEDLRFGNPHNINAVIRLMEGLGHLEQRIDGRKRRWLRITNNGRAWLLRQEPVDLPDNPVAPSQPPVAAGPGIDGPAAEPELHARLTASAPDEPRLHLNDDLSLPMDYLTKKTGIFGQSGSGKSNTAAVIISELIEHGCRTAVIDPQGDWWGLRSSFDGQAPGLPIIIMGGEHGDLDLWPEDAPRVLRILEEFKQSVVLDTSHMSKADQTSFIADFISLVYVTKWQDSPIHLVFDEADQVVPQPNSTGIDKGLHEELSRLRLAMTDIAKRGRKRGIGFTLISQRPINLFTEVLMLIDMMVILRLMGSRDVAAIDDWTKYQQSASGGGKKIISSLPELPSGTAWFWAPSWIGAAKIAVRRRTTFDSGATPEFGADTIEPAVFAEVDQAALEALNPEPVDQTAPATEAASAGTAAEAEPAEAPAAIPVAPVPVASATPPPAAPPVEAAPVVSAPPSEPLPALSPMAATLQLEILTKLIDQLVDARVEAAMGERELLAAHRRIGELGDQLDLAAIDLATAIRQHEAGAAYQEQVIRHQEAEIRKAELLIGERLHRFGEPAKPRLVALSD